MTVSSTPARRASSFSRFLAPLGLLAVMWLIQIADAVLPGSFTWWGLRSWDLSSLPGLLLGPLLHAGWSHLMANSLPFIVLGCLVAVEGAKRFWAVTGLVAVIGGAGTWLVNTPGTLTVGASVLVFGYFGYIVLRVIMPGRLSHRLAYAAIAVIVIGSTAARCSAASSASAPASRGRRTSSARSAAGWRRSLLARRPTAASAAGVRPDAVAALRC